MDVVEKRIAWRDFIKSIIIRPSPIMSTLCNSIFRLEPYTNCMYRCVYCYARAPSMNEKITVKSNYPMLFKRLVRILKKSFSDYLPAFRLSTLSDPFQPIERKYKLSLALMKIADKYDVPLIINTKSILPLEDPWLSVIKDLASKRKAIVQYTIVVLDDSEARIIEPFALPPSERLKAIDKLSKLGIPTIVRFQPLIPYVNTSASYMENAVKVFANHGAKQIISEFVRIRYDELQHFAEILRKRGDNPGKITKDDLWEEIPETIQKRPNVKFRKSTFETLSKTATEHGLAFATCRECFFELRTAETCCGIHNLTGVLWRKTAYEIFRDIDGERNGILYFDMPYVEQFRIRKLREIITKHFETLHSILENKELFHKICP